MDSQLIPDLRRHQGFEVYIQHSNYKMYRYILLTILISFITGNLTVNSQSHGINRDKFRIHIEQTSEKINIDGLKPGEMSILTQKEAYSMLFGKGN